jgi:hypothetical protein
MTKGPTTNLPASVHRRLLNLDPQRRGDFNLILTRYALERWLFRLSKSTYVDRFILKGAMLFAVWLEEPYRSTRDLDLLGFGELSRNSIEEVFASTTSLDVEPDGLVFDTSSLTVEPIREENEYQGWRVRLLARMDKLRIPIQVDIGIGDVVSPLPEIIEYPTLLQFPAPRIRAYRRETVIAEKLHAMVTLGELNSRMKDFYDISILARQFSFEGAELWQAIEATFRRRDTIVPSEIPIAFTDEFAADVTKEKQWRAFLRRIGKDLPSLAGAITDLRAFLLPPLHAVSQQKSFAGHWSPGGPWQPSSTR